MSRASESSSRDSANRSPPPLYRDSGTLAEWILGRFQDDARPLGRRLCEQAIRLLELVVLALKGREREERIADAEERVICLRADLRIAAALGQLDDEQLLYALGLLDAIGRQLGGWARSLGGC